MDLNGLRLLSVMLISCLNVVSGHECLNIDPMPYFNMKRFLGTWYAMRTTSPQTRCFVYDFNTAKSENINNVENTQQPGTSNVAENTKTLENINCIRCENCQGCKDCIDCIDTVDSVNCKKVIGGKNNKDCKFCKNCTNITGLEYRSNLHLPLPINYRFDGVLKANPRLPSKMSVRFTETGAPAKSSFVVFATDYSSYAGVYSCRETADGHIHSVTILSRTEVLDKLTLRRLTKFIKSYYKQPNVKLLNVDHKHCNHPFERYDPNGNVANVIQDDVHISVHFTSINKTAEIP